MVREPSSAPALSAQTELMITSPAPGTTVESGTTISVVVEPKPGFTVDEVLVVGRNGAANDTQAPFEVDFAVPSEAFGPYSISAFGKNATTEEYYASETVQLLAQPAAVLLSIEIKPDPAFLVGIGDTLRLSVTGQFADGIPREIPAEQVTFTASPPGIVTVDSAGVATAEAIGQSTVEATFQSFSANRTVKVLAAGALDLRRRLRRRRRVSVVGEHILRLRSG